MFDDCIIMAGGSGTRLWPASNSRRPKQFLAFAPGQSFFSSALERALAVIDREGDGRVIVIAGEGHVPHVRAACGKFSPEDRARFCLIREPAAKNTAAALLCGAIYASRSTGRDRALLVLTSDHLISPLERFRQDAEAAAFFARRGELAVFGIPPSAPETGYGYIEAGEELSAEGAGLSGKVYRARSFREKPDRKTAEEFLAAGRFFWNSGMFAFSSAFILGEFRRHAPDLNGAFGGLQDPPPPAPVGELGLLEGWPGLAEAYTAAPAISFDYAIAEKCSRRVMVRASFDWTDVGSWDEYARLLGDGGGERYLSGAENCFVDSDIPAALCGVEDLIVVIRSRGEAPSALIVKKGETQRVREIVEKIKAAGRTELL